MEVSSRAMEEGGPDEATFEGLSDLAVTPSLGDSPDLYAFSGSPAADSGSWAPLHAGDLPDLSLPRPPLAAAASPAFSLRAAPAETGLPANVTLGSAPRDVLFATQRGASRTRSLGPDGGPASRPASRRRRTSTSANTISTLSSSFPRGGTRVLERMRALSRPLATAATHTGGQQSRFHTQTRRDTSLLDDLFPAPGLDSKIETPSENRRRYPLRGPSTNLSPTLLSKIKQTSLRPSITDPARPLPLFRGRVVVLGEHVSAEDLGSLGFSRVTHRMSLINGCPVLEGRVTIASKRISLSNAATEPVAKRSAKSPRAVVARQTTRDAPIVQPAIFQSTADATMQWGLPESPPRTRSASHHHSVRPTGQRNVQRERREEASVSLPRRSGKSERGHVLGAVVHPQHLAQFASRTISRQKALLESCPFKGCPATFETKAQVREHCQNHRLGLIQRVSVPPATRAHESRSIA